MEEDDLHCPISIFLDKRKKTKERRKKSGMHEKFLLISRLI